MLPSRFHLRLSACALAATQTPQALQSLPAGAYQLEKPHASLLFRVKHIGLSNYTARFTDFDATLDFDPTNPAARHVKAIINPLSVQADHPTDTGWDSRIGEDLMEGRRIPADRLRLHESRDHRRIHRQGHGQPHLHGRHRTRHPRRHLQRLASSNAALYAGRPAVGFSARGKLNRTDFGLTAYRSIVSDDVEIIIEAEFTQAC